MANFRSLVNGAHPDLLLDVLMVRAWGGEGGKTAHPSISIRSLCIVNVNTSPLTSSINPSTSRTGCLQPARSTTPVTFSVFTQWPPPSFSRFFMPSYYPTTSGGLPVIRHTFSSSSRCSAQVGRALFPLHRDTKRSALLSPGNRVRDAGHARRLRGRSRKLGTVHRRVNCLQRRLLRFVVFYLYPCP